MPHCSSLETFLQMSAQSQVLETFADLPADATDAGAGEGLGRSKDAMVKSPAIAVQVRM
jgi:hypothetical protein